MTSIRQVRDALAATLAEVVLPLSGGPPGATQPLRVEPFMPDGPVTPPVAVVLAPTVRVDLSDEATLCHGLRCSWPVDILPAQPSDAALYEHLDALLVEIPRVLDTTDHLPGAVYAELVSLTPTTLLTVDGPAAGLRADLEVHV